MAKLPVMSGRDVVRTFQVLGWSVARQSASHIIMVRDGHAATLSVPDHSEIAKGTLRSLLRTSGVSVAEFVAATP